MLLVVSSPVRLAAREPKWSVNVNVTLTEEGKKIDRPTLERPAYYRTLVIGYREEGKVDAGEKPPAVDKVVSLLSKALVQEGYVESKSGKTPSPSLLLCYHWGTANPNITRVEGIDPQSGKVVKLDTFLNQDNMIALVSGGRGKLPTEPLDVNDKNAQQEATEERYFVIVTAYDYHTAVVEKKKKLLWIARISAPSVKAASLEAGLPSLIDTAAPFFGREAMPPQHLSVPVMREGKVDVGTPTVRPDAPTEAIPEKKSPRN